MCFKLKIFIFLVSFMAAGVAYACPKIAGLVDVNCDGQVKIVVTGDSIVRGRGDPNITSTNGGYVLDLAEMYYGVNFYNLGMPGYSSLALFNAFRKSLPQKKKTFRKLRKADYIMIEVGTNDYWSYKPVAASLRNINRLEMYLNDFSQDTFATKPVIFIATLPPTRRTWQQPFISSLNKAMLSSPWKKRLKVMVRFDKLPLTILSADDLHPNGEGYREMSIIAATALSGPVQKLVDVATPTPTPISVNNGV